MKLAKFPLFLFEEKEQKDTYSLFVPGGSIFRKAVILHDGIYLLYEIPNTVLTLQDQIEKSPSLSTVMKDTYYIAQQEKPIPENAEYIDVLDTVIQTPQGQGILMFPLYRLKE